MALKYIYFISNLIALWFLIFFYRTNPYCVKFMDTRAQSALLYFAIAYTIGGFFYYKFNKKVEATHAYIAFKAITSWFKQLRPYLSKFPYDKQIKAPSITLKEKNAILILLVKMFYLPLMTTFVIGNSENAYRQLESYLTNQFIFTPQSLCMTIFPLIINIIFVIDTAFYTVGYAIELPLCKNTVKSVEPSALGWASALICYPPFLGILVSYVPWYSTDIPLFQNVWLSIITDTIIIICYLIYLGGSVSLGWKCSNLTNRGIVQNGVYAYVRHPAYSAKNLAWWIGLLPNLSVPAILSTLTYTVIYFIRAITEERHLLQDPDYQEYCKKVRYRFIPYIY